MATRFGELPPSGSANQRLREILDGGYNYWATRPISSYQSRAALKKQIETRLNMNHYGVAPYAVRAGKMHEAHQALLAAHHILEEEQGNRVTRHSIPKTAPADVLREEYVAAKRAYHAKGRALAKATKKRAK